jgi:hypothetical protein
MSHHNTRYLEWAWALPRFYTEDKDYINAEDLIEELEKVARKATWDDLEKTLRLICSV